MKFFEAAADSRQTILDEAQKLAKKAGSTSQQYLRIMKKVADDSEAYLEKETTRYVTPLTYLGVVLITAFRSIA